MNKLPYLFLLYPIPHLWLMGLVMEEKDHWQFRDVGGAFLVLFDALFALLVLLLVKLSFVRLRFKWAGLGLLLVATAELWHRSDKTAGTTAYLGGWLVLLVLAALWVYAQRAYLD